MCMSGASVVGVWLKDVLLVEDGTKRVCLRVSDQFILTHCPTHATQKTQPMEGTRGADIRQLDCPHCPCWEEKERPRPGSQKCLYFAFCFLYKLNCFFRP